MPGCCRHLGYVVHQERFSLAEQNREPAFGWGIVRAHVLETYRGRNLASIEPLAGGSAKARRLL